MKIKSIQIVSVSQIRGCTILISLHFCFRRGTPAQIVDACMRRSPLWRHLQSYQLVENMRARQAADHQSPADAAAFCEWLLRLGEGRLPADDDGNIQLPAELCMDADLPQILRWVFGDLQAMPDDPAWMASRAVLAAKNVDVDAINALATATFPGEATRLLSADAMVGDAEEELQIPTEYLNTLTAPGFPPHLLDLKTGMPVMLLRNLSPAEGLCNGSRLIIQRVISGRLLQATIATGPQQGRQVFLPRVALRPPEDAFPFSWERRQFPVKPAFGMTIHKAQGQTLGRVAVLLTEPAFTHGQLYVAASRVGRADQLRFALPAGRGGRTANVVYGAALH